ncbi:hypothetical protein [Vibrio vulnificus]|uniref:hypothetical protein n=1 Tax=Vibrio vulnificus TaxID=672 RepID=UPI0013EEBF70|nr:hypothetical protein [Vibrio vulnificus]EHH0708331.1 hypothetical protein [Vibrio vulnificus]EHZ2718069.1 hypothetical protein [Vibrio vulnificus]EIX4876878.1 hypothetical protein [Vibrio vulnificus]EJA3295635.1 hypothetical protein [Vibrio vulnificus]EKA7334939.1 hypothetical protein [Vibrio vulnificus]
MAIEKSLFGGKMAEPQPCTISIMSLYQTLAYPHAPNWQWLAVFGHQRIGKVKTMGDMSEIVTITSIITRHFRNSIPISSLNPASASDCNIALCIIFGNSHNLN